MKQHYLSHVAYTTSNVLAAMERVMENVHAGVINPNDSLGLSTFPMTTADQAALGDPLEDFWIQGSTPLTASASASPTTGNAPLSVGFTGSASGGTAPYSYSWNFGDGSSATTQNPSHTYNSAGTYTATLTVTDSSSPAKTATSTVTITASPIAGTPPGAPTGLTATAGNGQVSLSWTPPASNGGVNITSYRVYRGTASGNETLLTSGGCSGLGAVTSCTDTGLSNGQPYYYKVSAVNAIGEGAQGNEATATPFGSCTHAQLLGNPGFENGSSSPAPWKLTSTHTPLDVISNNSTEPPHSGSWDAWLDGWGSTTTDTLSQSIILPTGCSSYNLSFWLHVDTAETSTTSAFDKLTVQVLNSSGTVLSTLHTYSNLDHNTGYAQHSFSLSAYAGQNITLKFTGTEDYTKQTSFVIDDTALNVG
jgi:PKD repeat protein